jgi:polyisoprenoid-binding protein YceI
MPLLKYVSFKIYSMKKTFLIFLSSIFLPAMLFGQTRWQETSGSVTFTIKNRGSAVHGHFGSLKTALIFSPDKLGSSSLKGWVDASSINTDNSKRDKDLQGETYFNADKFKTVEVSSTKLTKKGTQYSGTFNVVMKGVTKQVEIPFSFTEKGNEAEFKGSFSVNRRDFGVGSKSGLAMFMGDDAAVIIDIKAKK